MAWITRLINAGIGSPYRQSATGPWREAAGKNESPYADDFIALPKMVMIRVRLTDLTDMDGLSCNWTVNDSPATSQACSKAFQPEGPVQVGIKIAVSVRRQPVASTTVSPRVRIILGLGDSYSAGEGTPDVPVTWRDKLPEKLWPFNGGGAINSYVEAPTQWFSNRCNRSFYSYQNMLAMRLAAQDKHSIVSFVHLACAGAEVLDGILAPQRVAPGAPGKCKGPSDRPKSKRDEVDPDCDVPYSQLRAAANINSATC